MSLKSYKAAKWIEDNFDILQKSQMFGGKPNDGNVYGYSCRKAKKNKHKRKTAQISFTGKKKPHKDLSHFSLTSSA